MRLFVFFLLICVSCEQPDAQPGCTDPQALNFNPLAMENDGSCLYNPTSYTPGQITLLPSGLDECSGLAFFANRLWTHEDGGTPDQLYVIDTLTGALLQIITIANADNLDWEDLAEDEEHLYIGDFGNNFGNRTDLRILKVKKSDLLAGTATPELIEFSFSDQTVLTPAQNANDFDCEAFFFWNDSLHLFSKNWLNFKTRHYVLPATPGSHVAQLRDSLAVQGQITGADITDDGKAVLLGYNVSTGETFLWLLFDFPGSRFFSGNKRKISLGSALLVSQPEGIVFRNETYGYICSERYSALPQKLLRFDIRQWTENPSMAAENFESAGISVAPNPFSASLSIDFQKVIPGLVSLLLVDANGKTVRNRSLKDQITPGRFRLETDSLPIGSYWLVVRAEEKVYSGMVVKR